MTEEEIKGAAMVSADKYVETIFENTSKRGGKTMRTWCHSDYHNGFITGVEANTPRWIPVIERLPEVEENKMRPMLGLNGKHRVIVYYIPEHFKTVEWEDWDDYNQEDFPYTEEDNENGVVWLRPGFYNEVECEKCDGYWSSPLPISHWMMLP